MRRNVQREGPQPSLGNSITYSSKADAAYAAIRSRILNGNLVASETLNQEQLAGELGVSTTPLREALRRLESEGLVLVQPHRDVVVAPLDVDEMVSLYEVREVLDSLAAGLAAEHHDERDRNEMEAASRQLRDPRIDPVDANRTFHAAIYRASHNEVLIGLLDRLWDKSDRYRRAISGIARDSDTVQSHVDLLRTVLDGDADRAYQLMREHIRTVHEVLEDVVRTDGVESASHDLGVGA
jgi:DNA-binding GntR family transcriptional regulator